MSDDPIEMAYLRCMDAADKISTKTLAEHAAWAELTIATQRLRDLAVAWRDKVRAATGES